MLPAFGIEGLRALMSEQDDGRAVVAQWDDTADSGDGDAGDLPWNAGIGGGSEEKLVVFSAVECALQAVVAGDGGK